MNYIHYAWSQDIISSEDPPACGDVAARTQDFGEVTCAVCEEYLRQSVEEWVQDLPPPPLPEASLR